MQTLSHDMERHEFERCTNCGYSSGLVPIAELSNNYQYIITQWIEKPLQPGEKICHACKIKLKKCENEENPPRQYGHDSTCIGCGKSILGKRVHVHTHEDDLLLLYPMYKNYIRPETPCTSCHPCYLRLSRKKTEKKLQIIEVKEMSTTVKIESIDEENLTAEVDTDTVPDDISNSVADSIQRTKNEKEAVFENDRLILPGYKRVLTTNGKCVIPKCKAPGQAIARPKRKLIFLQTNTLLSRRGALCKQHAHYDKWGCYGVDNFTMTHVEEALNMSEKPVPIIDFDAINEMPDHICKYWTGLTADEFKDLYEKLNAGASLFMSLRNALAIHLLRKRTGDSLMKLANLFLIPIPRLSKQLLMIEKLLETYDNEQQMTTEPD